MVGTSVYLCSSKILYNNSLFKTISFGFSFKHTQLSAILIYSLTSNYIKLYHTATLKWYILASTCIVLLMFQLWLEQRLVAAFAKFRFRVSIFAICIPHICPFWYTTILFRGKGKGKGVCYSRTGSPCDFEKAANGLGNQTSYSRQWWSWLWVKATRYVILIEHRKPDSKDGGRKQFGDKGQIVSFGRIECFVFHIRSFSSQKRRKKLGIIQITPPL